MLIKTEIRIGQFRVTYQVQILSLENAIGADYCLLINSESLFLKSSKFPTCKTEHRHHISKLEIRHDLSQAKGLRKVLNI